MRPQGEVLQADYTGNSDLVSHPAFNGSGRLLLPRDNDVSDYGTRLSDVASLMPYHGNIRPDEVLDAVNHRIDEVSQGRKAELAAINQAHPVWSHRRINQTNADQTTVIQLIVPNAFGACFTKDDLTVFPVAPPRLQGLCLGGTNLTLRWNSRIGRVDTLLSDTNLTNNPSTWPVSREQQDSQTADSGTNAITTALAQECSRFFLLAEQRCAAASRSRNRVGSSARGPVGRR